MTETYNLKLKKPDMSDTATPAPFNENFDKIDEQIADLNRYKPVVEDHATSINTLNTNLQNGLIEMKTYVDNYVGSIASVIDTINGEEV